MRPHLEAEVKKRQMEEQRRISLEKALAIPLASGRITLNDGRIGISGRFLFAVNSDELQPEGRKLLSSLVLPLRSYLASRDEMMMCRRQSNTGHLCQLNSDQGLKLAA